MPLPTASQVKIARSQNKTRKGGLGNHWVTGHQKLIKNYKVGFWWLRWSLCDILHMVQSMAWPLVVLCVNLFTLMSLHVQDVRMQSLEMEGGKIKVSLKLCPHQGLLQSPRPFS